MNDRVKELLETSRRSYPLPPIKWIIDAIELLSADVAEIKADQEATLKLLLSLSADHESTRRLVKEVRLAIVANDDAQPAPQAPARPEGGEPSTTCTKPSGEKNTSNPPPSANAGGGDSRDWFGEWHDRPSKIDGDSFNTFVQSRIDAAVKVERERLDIRIWTCVKCSGSWNCDRAPDSPSVGWKPKVPCPYCRATAAEAEVRSLRAKLANEEQHYDRVRVLARERGDELRRMARTVDAITKEAQALRAKLETLQIRNDRQSERLDALQARLASAEKVIGAARHLGTFGALTVFQDALAAHDAGKGTI